MKLYSLRIGDIETFFPAENLEEALRKLYPIIASVDDTFKTSIINYQQINIKEMGDLNQ